MVCLFIVFFFSFNVKHEAPYGIVVRVIFKVCVGFDAFLDSDVFFMVLI
jgi:hypothetical protein